MADPTTRYISNSEVGTFKRCLRKWWLSYYRELIPATTTVVGIRELGTRLHVALAERYQPNGVSVEDAIRLVRQSYDDDYATLIDEQRIDEATELMKEKDLADAMITGYFDWVEEEGVDQGLEFVAAEQTLTHVMPIQHSVPVVIRGKLDVVAHRTFDDALLFMDHKSVGSFAAATEFLEESQQMLTYLCLQIITQMREGGEQRRCDGAIYNMLRRVKRGKQAKPPFFARTETRYNLTQLRKFYAQLHVTVQRIVTLERALDAGGDPLHLCPPSPDGDCSWKCDYRTVCPMFDDGSNAEGFLAAVYTSYDRDARYAEHEATPD